MCAAEFREHPEEAIHDATCAQSIYLYARLGRRGQQLSLIAALYTYIYIIHITKGVRAHAWKAGAWLCKKPVCDFASGSLQILRKLFIRSQEIERGRRWPDVYNKRYIFRVKLRSLSLCALQASARALSLCCTLSLSLSTRRWNFNCTRVYTALCRQSGTERKDFVTYSVKLASFVAS